ncbi:hypothetical protein EPN42_05675 [bacterium]|nr:MAG: hypothetical protein EPN42_05675 [bacterium]
MVFSAAANRSTWQIVRRKVTRPALGSGTTVAIGMVVIATYVGARAPHRAIVQNFPGAPIVEIDLYAFLPPDAGSVVKEGDALIDLERSERWEAVQVLIGPSVCAVGLKRTKGKSVAD